MLIDSTTTDNHNPEQRNTTTNLNEDEIGFEPSLETLLQPEGLFLDATNMSVFGEEETPSKRDARKSDIAVVEPAQAGNNEVWNGADFNLGGPILTPMSAALSSPSLSTQSAPSPQVGKPKKRGRPKSTKALQRIAHGSPNLYSALHKATELGYSPSPHTSGTASVHGHVLMMPQDGLPPAGMAPQDVFSMDQQESYSWMSELKGRRKRTMPQMVTAAVPSAMENNIGISDTVTGNPILMASLGMRVPPGAIAAAAELTVSPLRHTHTASDASPKLPLMRKPREETPPEEEDVKASEPSDFFMDELFEELLEEPPPSTSN